MANVYVNPDGSEGPKVWARNARGDCIWGSLSTRRQHRATTRTEAQKQAEGYAYIQQATWEAIQVVLMGTTPTDAQIDQEASALAQVLIRRFGARTKVYGLMTNSAPPALPAQKAASAPAPALPPPPLAPPKATKTIGAAIAEFARAPGEDKPGASSSWSW